MSEESVPGIGDPDQDVSKLPEIHPRYRRPMTMTADVALVEHQLKKVTVSSRLWNPNAPTFEYYCEEGSSLGGKSRFPMPMGYLMGSIGASLLTQLIRYASMLDVKITAAGVHVEVDTYLHGTVKAGDIDGGASACRTRLVVESTAALDDVKKVIRLAKRGCFVEHIVQRPVPLTSTVVLNGREVAIDLE